MVYLIAGGVVVWAVTTVITVLAVWFGGAWLRFFNYHRHKKLPLPDGPNWGRRIQHWVAEADALVRIHLWRLEPGRSKHTPKLSEAARPVLCVHGFTQDRTNFSALRRRLWGLGRPSVSVDLGLPGKHPSAFAAHVSDAIASLHKAYPNAKMDVVCHSMGGLVLRHALAENPQLAQHIACIVTLGSPHHGTAAARGPLRWWPEADGLSRGSAWIAELPTFADLTPDARVVTIAGTADYIVYPVSTCHLPGTEAVDLHGVGHAGLLTRAEILDLIVLAFNGEPVQSVSPAEADTAQA
ncbi:MAG: esterase/lipase family protein [Myxococcota bacterium]